MIHALLLILYVGMAYLLGSIPTAVWLGKRLYHVDVREHGSRNAGATNTIRVLGIRIGLAVLAIDVAKGFAAVQLARLAPWLLPGDWALDLLRIGLGLAAFFGHLFPVFAQFKGGKGVATLLGVVLALEPLAALSALGVFALTLTVTRYVSLGSMLAGLSFPLFAYFAYGERSVPMTVFNVMLALLLLYTHRANIKRLSQGEESRFTPTRHGSAGGQTNS